MLKRYSDRYQEWRTALAEQKSLSQTQGLSPEEQAFYRQQIEHIDALSPSIESIEALNRDYARSQNAHALIELTNKLAAQLSDNEESVANQLSESLSAAEQVASMDPESSASAERIKGLIIECQELAEEYTSMGTQVECDPETAATLEQRMNQWLELQHKYGNSIEAVLAKRAELSQKLDQQGDIKGTLDRLQTQIQKREKALRAMATELREQREQARTQLAKTCMPLLKSLGFKQAQLSIDLPREEQLTEQGDCRCVFQFAPNPGQPALPLAKIASSGEAARVLLALKTLLADCDQTPILVFDEVDANVGGEIGSCVGEQLARLAQNHHVFCVTHLPQVAAQADQHYCITKKQTKQTTQVSIAALHSDKQERIAELARMLGDRNSASAIQHAESLLSQKTGQPTA